MGRKKSPAPKTFARQMTDKQREIRDKKRKEEFARKMAQLPETSINKLKFLRLVRSLTGEFSDEFQFTASALAALQAAAETFVVNVMKEGTTCCENEGRDTLTPEDMAMGIQKIEQNMTAQEVPENRLN